MKRVKGPQGNKRATLRERGDDLYETPPEAVRALMAAEKLPKRIWEPACGPGNIVRELEAKGHTVLASDIKNYWTKDEWFTADFLQVIRPHKGYNCIVTNPPFKLANEFVAHAIKLVPKTIMLLRLQFLEGVRRSPILDEGGLARVYVFRKRLPMMHRANWSGPRASSGMAFAWFVWERGHTGPASIQRISWETFA